MKTRRELTYAQVMLVALITELTLILVQIVYLNIYFRINEGTELAFSNEYMKTRGFYIFQVIGFFLYTTVVYFIVDKMKNRVLNKLLVLVVSGGIVELSFYLMMSSSYEGAFLYSILDKIIAAVFGLVLFNYTSQEEKKPRSYL